MKTKKVLIILFIIFIIGNLNIILNFNDFVYLGSSDFSDIPITHYPNLLFIQRAVQDYHQVPLWSNLIFSGYPFAANPLSGLWYFPGWIALIFKLPAGINLTLLVHLLIGLYGMYFFLRTLKISNIGSILGSIAFIFSTKIYAHLGAGHLSLIYAISWTPWLMFFTNKFKSEERGFKTSILSGLIWGLILLADLRWSIPAFLIWIVLIVGKNINLKIFAKFIGISLSTGLLTSLATWLPLLQFLSLSNRASLTPNEQLIFSMSFFDFLNLFFPFFEGNAETRVYPGAAVILLSVVGLFLSQQNSKFRKWYFLALISILFSLGENIPGMSYIFGLPGFSLMRVPSRFLFPFIFALSVISAYVFDSFYLGKLSYKIHRIFFLFPFVVFVILFAVGSFFITKEFPINLIWSIIIFSTSFIVLFLLFSSSIKPILLSLFLLFLLTTDLFFVNISSLRFEPFEKVINNHPDLMSKLEVSEPGFRVYTPSYSISQEQGAFFGLNQVNGVDPLQLQEYVDFFENASGVAVEKYSVTLPPFETGNPSKDNGKKCPKKELLQKLNTKYVISAFSLSDCDLGDHTLLADQYVYELGNEDNYLQLENCPDGKLNYQTIKYSANEIILNIESCGGILQISEINYPGWQVFVDGNQVSLESKTLFRTLRVPEGRHELKMVFRPQIVLVSLSIQSFAWLISLFYIIFANRKRENENHS